MPATVPAWAWPLLPLDDRTWSGDLPGGLSVDVTFRLALVAKLAGRRLDYF